MKFHFIKCCQCGKYIDTRAKRDNVLPTMMQFVQQDGKVISICRDCIIGFGKIIRDNDEDAKEQFLYNLDSDESGLLEDDY